MRQDRNWTVLLVGGASGSGKSSLAYALARYYEVSVLEIDDIGQALKAMTTRDALPQLHYYESGVNWKDIGVKGNVDWLMGVSKEIIPAIKAIVDNHLEGNIPVIIEGDFLDPAFAASFDNPKVKAIFVHEADKDQIVQNYLAREGGNMQCYRADISTVYGDWLADACNKLGVSVVESRPWDTLLERAIACIR